MLNIQAKTGEYLVDLFYKALSKTGKNKQVKIILPSGFEFIVSNRSEYIDFDYAYHLFINK